MNFKYMLSIESLDKAHRRSTRYKSFGDLIDELECCIIMDAIRRCNGVQKHAAAMLHVNESTMNMKIRKLIHHGIRVFDGDPREQFPWLFSKKEREPIEEGSLELNDIK